MKSRLKRDFHARFRENAMVKVHVVTRLAAIEKKEKRPTYWLQKSLTNCPLRDST